MREKPMRLVAILGPTACGKTALAVALARRLGEEGREAEIISGDSMQVYRGLDIGTAKPSMEERGGIPHHLIDIVSPTDQFSAVDFVREATAATRSILSRGRIPILAGGTGLYAKAFLEGYEFCAAGADPAYRKKMEELAASEGALALYARLQTRDPEAAARIHPSNVRRVIRALEAAESGGERISRSRGYEETGRLAFDAIVIGIEREREELYRRIDERVLIMFRQGLAEEVEDLLAQGVPGDSQAMQAIGYKETVEYVGGRTSREEAVAAVQRATRRFAKRQLTWYRRMPYIRWHHVADGGEGDLLEAAREDLRGAF